MNIVVQETPAPGYQPMVLPWEKRLEDGPTDARIGGGTIPPHSNNIVIEFPGITTATTIWFFPDAAMDILLGNGNSTSITIAAGGCMGFTCGNGDASGALRVTYKGDTPATYTFVWAGN